MADKVRAGGKKNRKIGRNKTKCEIYRKRSTRERNKLKRVRQSNGLKAAVKYAKEHDLSIPQK